MAFKPDILKSLCLRWYVKTFAKLPVAEIFYKIANKGVSEISSFRRFEKLAVKYATYRLDLEYFDSCLELDLVPEFLKFRPPNIAAYNNKDAFYTKAVKEQRRAVAEKLKEIKTCYRELVTRLISSSSDLDFCLLWTCVKQQVVNQIVERKKKSHNKKLYNLWKRQRPPVPDCIVNLSDIKLSLFERNALMFGLNHHILPQRIDSIGIKADIDSQVRQMCRNNNIQLSFDKKNSIREATDRFIHEAVSLCNSKKNRNLHKRLRSLSNNKAIKVCKMDKGTGVVIMNDSDYYKKLDCIVNDTSRFSLIDYNINTEKIHDCTLAPWIQKADSVSYYCRTYIKPLVDDKLYYRLLPTGSQPGRLYGMAKVHKNNCPMRPVLSAINTPEYHLAKWLESQVKPLLNSRYTVTSSSVFIDELRQQKPNPTDHCVSFDIKSLFTNVPLREVIDDIANTVFPRGTPPLLFTKAHLPMDEKKNKNTKRITKTAFKHMLNVCSESIFLYKDAVYKQHDGVAMGSPLAPLLAEWFVSNIENNILESDVSCKPTFYKRYVDDVFAIFKSEEDRDSFFSLLNTAHPNLKFTMEVSTNSLPFLDTTVSINKNRFETRVYRKPTNTGILLNYKSVAPRRWKKSLICCMLMRALRISSNLKLFESELEIIRETFLKNSYPSDMIEKAINDFVTSHKVCEGCFEDVSKPVRQEKGADKRQVYFRIPFVGKPSSRLQRRIQNNLQGDDLDVKVAFCTTKVGEYFNLKSRCSRLFTANVVYKFTCSNDSNTTYLGETKRQLFERILEHRGKDKKSAVLHHLYECNHCQNNDIVTSFEIVQRCSAKNIGSTEALLISKHRPSLNTQLGPGKGAMVSLTLY